MEGLTAEFRAFEEVDPVRIVFGDGAEARTAQVLVELGAQRVMLVAMARHRGGAARIAAALGDRCVGIFDEVKQHVPEPLVNKARRWAVERGVDWVVSHGGGSCTGFAKAIALTEPVRVGAVVTTYSGSERTSIWGMTGKDGKRTGRDERVRPALVVYDPRLTLALDKDLSLSSLFNALAHVVGALTSGTSDAEAAVAAAAQVMKGLDALSADPNHLGARSEALYGAYLAAACIERSELGLQHAMAHTLGGDFGIFHANAHTAVLPYSLAFNAPAAPAAVERLRSVLGEDPPAALYDRARELGLPHGLKDLGLVRDDLKSFTTRVLGRGYPNPRAVTSEALTLLVSDAYHARRPSLRSRRRLLGGEGVHAALLATERGTPLESSKAVLVALHGRGSSADRLLHDFEPYVGGSTELCLLAPQALENSWYPHPFTAPIGENQPFLDSALSMVDAAWEAAADAVGPGRVIVAGFSQGACLALAWARSRSYSPAALLALSGAELEVDGGYDNLVDAAVTLSKSATDPWIDPERFERTAAALGAVVSGLAVRIEPGATHRIYEADGERLGSLVGELTR